VKGRKEVMGGMGVVVVVMIAVGAFLVAVAVTMVVMAHNAFGLDL
jgi:hypothetical protein